jgi:radical SAM protein with 4Fe4S-binding SPASM domain
MSSLEKRYPFFPLMLKDGEKELTVYNPTDLKDYTVNSDAYRLISMCNGRNSVNNIVKHIACKTRLDEDTVRQATEKILGNLSAKGMIWLRRERMRNKPAPQPQQFYWDITNACNLRCAHCVLDSGNKLPDELTTDECKRLLDELVAYGVPMVIFSGGEPLLRPDLFDIASRAARFGMSLQLATNGTLLDKDAAKEISRLNIDVQVSLDGSSAQIHDRFRGRSGAFNAALHGIEQLKSANVPFTIGCVFNRLNIDDIGNLLDLSTSLEAHAFRLIPFIPFGRGCASDDLEPSPQEFQAVTEYLRKKRQTSTVTITDLEFEFTYCTSSNNLFDSAQPFGCDGGSSSFTITASGDVLPCSFFSGVKAENIRDHTFAWIWENSPFLHYFRDIRAADIQGICQHCEWFSQCLGGCPAANFAKGKMLEPNVHCWVAKRPTKNEG